jgi:hypothetical protein
LALESAVETKAKSSKNQKKITYVLPRSNRFRKTRHGIQVRVDAYTCDIKSIEINFSKKRTNLNVINKADKIKLIYPKLYVVLNIFEEYSYSEKLISHIKHTSKDLIDELYFKPASMSYRQNDLFMNLLKQNPKMKKLYFHSSSDGSDIEDLKEKADCLLEN